MMIDEYTLLKCIGKGAFGEVYLTSKKGSNKLFATKKVPKQKVEAPQIKKYFINEISILKTILHKNIVKLEAIRQTVHNYYIITEFYNGGGLHDCLKRYRMINGRAFSEEIVQYLIKQIVDALKYLHSRKIIHRDLKLENLLINFESDDDKNNLNMLKAEVKIIDFGFATYLDGSGLRYSILGSPINMDPILLNKLVHQNLSYLIGYDEKADIWSLGTVCYELLVGEMPFKALNMIELTRKVEIGIYHIPTNLSKETISFLNSMLQYNSKYRLSSEELSKHEFLTKNVSEFTKLDLSKVPNNRVDEKGFIINIKQNQQSSYQNYNYNTFFRHAGGYNYYGAGPKYYKANINPQYEMHIPQQTQGINQNPYQNYQYNKYLKQAYTYKDKIQNNEYNYNTNYNKKGHRTKSSSTRNDNNRGSNTAKKLLNEDTFINQQKNYQKNNEKNYNKNINPYGIPPISDTMSPSPIPFSGTIPINNGMTNTPIPFSGDNDEKYSSPNPFYENFDKLNNNMYNNTLNENRRNHFSNNNERKEVSSDALDSLFDMNIGNELPPEPEVVIERK